MKTIIITTVTFALTLLFMESVAQPVPMHEAQSIAAVCFSEIKTKSLSEVVLSSHYLVKDELDLPLYYVFYENSGGFVIISGEKRTVPVLAWSDSGFEGINTANTNPAFVYWMKIYENQIHHVRETNASMTQEAIDWYQKIENGEELCLRAAKDVSPLLSTTWNQGCGYNSQCPADAAGPCGRVYTGCVATAMAQIIRYMEYPEHGTGSTCYTLSAYGELCADFAAATYDYSIMPNGSGNSEVAELMYHCGVAVSMGYSPSGSGAYSSSVPVAFRNYFGYRNAILLAKNSYSEATWNSILRNEIDNNRPIYYSGHGSGGHAFVFDGYQGSGFFHVNWGWGGSLNGYFYCNDLTPGSHDYTSNQRAMVGAIPEPLFSGLDVSGATELSCATPVLGNLATGINYINYYGNTWPATPGKELVYYFTTTLPGRIRVKITNSTDGNLNAILLSHPHQDSIITYGTNGFILDDTEPGTYWLAVESSVATEPSFEIEIICPTPDAELIIQSGSISPEFIQSELPNVHFSSQIKNIGNTNAPACTIEYFLSDDMTFDFGTDVFLGSDGVPALGTGATATIQTTLTMPAGLTSGSKNIVFVVDRSNVVVEADDQNEYFTWATVPDPGLLDCTSAIAITNNQWYYNNTSVNGNNQVENYWSVTDLDGNEIVYSFIAPYSGMAYLWFTEKTPGQMYCMAYPVCNENTYLGSVWFNNTTDTIGSSNFYVNAGSEYYVVVDSKVANEAAFGVKIMLPGECPNPGLEYWGNLSLCDEESYPGFWTDWGYSNYQWYHNGLPIAGEITNSVMATEPGSYYVEITENGCTQQSETLTVNMSYPPDTAQIVATGPTTFCENESVLLEISNALSCEFQWTLNGENIEGATNPQFTATESGKYRLKTINGYCSVVSADYIDVIVNPLPIDIGENTPIPSSLPEHYYTFDENNYDSFNNYSFTCWDFQPADDRNGLFWKARDFTSENVFGYSPHNYAMPNAFTHTFWFRTTTTQGGAIVSFVNNPWGPTSQDAVVYMSDNGKLHFWMSNGGSGAELSSVQSYNDGNWHSVLITHETGILMEIDGGDEFLQISTPVSHGSFNGYWTYAGPQVPAAVSFDPTSGYFDGVLDELLCINESRYILRNYLDDDPELSIVPLGDTVLCDMGIVYFEVQNSQLGVEYRAWNNTLSSWHGPAVSGSGGNISIGGQLVNQTSEFVFYATQTATSCQTILSETITIGVYPTLTPSVSISSDGVNPICAGTTVQYTATLQNTGANPVIEWYVNGLAQGVHTINFSTIINASTDTVYAIVTPTYYCLTVASAQSNHIGFEVLPLHNPSVSIARNPEGIVCVETTVTFTATTDDCGTNPTYLWYLNGVHVGLNNPVYWHAGWDSGDDVHVEVIPDYACVATNEAVSNSETITISTPPEADYTIVSGGTCLGEDICFEYSGETEGLDHVEWIVINNSIYTYYSGTGPICHTPSAGILDIIVEAYDVYGCSDTAWYFSYGLVEEVFPEVSISSNQAGAVCHNQGIVFSANVENCGSNPQYQWYRNGLEVGTNQAEYFDTEFADNEEIWVVVTHNLACADGSSTESNHIFTVIHPMLNADINIASGICTGNQFCFNYDGDPESITNIAFEIIDGGPFYMFYGLGPHCYTPINSSIQLSMLTIDIYGCLDTAYYDYVVSPGIELNIFDTVYHCAAALAIYHAPAGYTSYEWSNGSGFSYLSTPFDGLYYLTVTNESGCSGVDSIVVASYPELSFDWPDDTTICFDETLIIMNPYPENTHTWYVGSGMGFSASQVEIGYTGENPIDLVLYVSDENCMYGDTMAVHFETCENIAPWHSSSFNMYPNPATTEIYFELSELPGDAIVYDATGRVVMQKPLTPGNNTLFVGNLSEGSYTCIVITQSGNRYRSRFVKQ